MNLLNIIVISSLSIFGVDASTQYTPVDPTLDRPEGTSLPTDTEVFGFVRYYLTKLLYRTRLRALLKPLISCPICMASFWGSLFYLELSTKINPVQWAIALLAISGLNRLAMLFARM